MKQLPADHYEYGIFKVYTVHMDYHIEIEHKCYSVPYSYVGKKVDVKITAAKIYIYYQSKEIASHNILPFNKRYSTNIEHMPKKHRDYIDQNKENFISWAKSISGEALIVVNGIFDSCKTVEYGYRPCLGLQRLYRTYGKTSFINACKKAVTNEIYNYRFIESSIKSLKENTEDGEKVISHDNIRGRDSYAVSGGTHE
jgi:hypothetical protein